MAGYFTELLCASGPDHDRSGPRAGPLVRPDGPLGTSTGLERADECIVRERDVRMLTEALFPLV
jgi:hypothetical protein